MTAMELDSESERALIAKAQAGDREAQGILLACHLPVLHAWVRLTQPALVRRRESSMDVVQSVFRQVLEDLGRFDYRSSSGFRNWLLTYASNKLRNLNRFHRSQRRTPQRESDASLSCLYASICTPSQHLTLGEQVAMFEGAYAKLGERDRQVILLIRIEGLTHAEVAERLGVTEAASKKALSRALVRLAGHMAEAEGGAAQ